MQERVRWILDHPAIAAATALRDSILADDSLRASHTGTASDDRVRGPLQFKAHEPKWFADSTAQPMATSRLARLVAALQPPKSLPSRHVLFTGPQGLGKTLYAKVLTHELRRYNANHGQELPDMVEVYGSNMSGLKDYDRVFRAIQASKRATVLFIDEIHTLDQVMATKLYKVMEDGLYAFHGELNPALMPPVLVVGATTDYGDMHAALKRRFGDPVHLEKLDRAQLGLSARSKPEPIEDAAVFNLVSVTQYSGAPWELLSLLGEADLIRRAEKAPAVTLGHVNQVFRALDLDEYGLRPVDRSVLTALFRSPR